MSQHDYVIDNASGATLRADLNAVLAAIRSLNSGNSAPSATAPGMLWWDVDDGLLKMRNGADSDWVSIASFDGTTFRPLSGGAGVALQGKQTIFVPATAMRPTVSNGCAALAAVETTAGRPDLLVLDFDAAADEHAQFSVRFPKSWDLGTVTFIPIWTSTATDTDGVAWGLQAVAVGDGDTMDIAYGTPVVVTDDNQGAAEDVLLGAESAAITIAGTPAVGKLCTFRLFRDVSDANDDMTEDARLLGVVLLFTTNAGNDA